MRLFFALPFAPDVQDDLASIAGPLVVAAPSPAWVAARNLHVTLKFLGEVPDAEVSRLVALGRHATAGMGALEVVVGGVGAFPNLGRPRVVWLGMDHAEPLAALAARLDAGAAALGIPRDERAWRPHVTLARVRNPLPPDQQAALARSAGGITTRRRVPVDAIVLMRSTTGAGASRYDVVETFPLGGS